MKPIALSVYLLLVLSLFSVDISGAPSAANARTQRQHPRTLSPASIDSVRAISSGRGVSDFLTPDGRFDLASARLSGYQGPINLQGFEANINPFTGQPRFQASKKAEQFDHPDDIHWDNSISPSLNGVDVVIYAMTVYQGKLIVAGIFSVAGSVPANNIAAWDGSNWSPLGKGVDGAVAAVCVFGTDLFVGGSFQTAGDSSANNIAAWNGSDWSPVGSGVLGDEWGGPPSVNALCAYNNKLIAAGSFVQAGDSSVASIAQWDNAGWSSVGYGMSGAWSMYCTVYALTVYNDRLIAGGDFVYADGNQVGGIASWDGGSWSSLDIGMGSDNPRVMSLAVFNGALIAGGYFSSSGGVITNSIASWNGASWSALGSGVDGDVLALTVLGEKLVAGGGFWNAGGTEMRYTASWNGSSWSPLGSSLDNNAQALIVYDGKLVAGGSFRRAGGKRATHVAAWDESVWMPLGSGTDGPVRALTMYDGKLIAGGTFTTIRGISANYIAAWDGANWSSLGSGMEMPDTLYEPGVFALTVFDGKLIAGGEFSKAGGVTSNNIASWDGSTWAPLDSGIIGKVYALAVYHEQLVAGGRFSMAGGSAASHVAVWHNSAWSPMGTGIDGEYSIVYALMVYGEDLIVGGNFTTIDGMVVNSIASWNGSTWSPLGSGMEGEYEGYAPVKSLAEYEGDLIAGGQFMYAGGWPANNIALWYGGEWWPLGEGINGGVFSLTQYHDKLIAGGYFSTADGLPAMCVASWDWTNGFWSSLGSGTGVEYPWVHALTSFNSAVIVGGQFAMAGNKVSAHVARWTESSTCCIGTTGNIDGDPDDITDIADLMALVDYLFFTGPLSSCSLENDIDQDGTVDIADLMALVDFLFFEASLLSCP